VTETNEIAAARHRRLVSQGLASPLIGEIVEALLASGGVASAGVVADTVARRRGGQRASPALIAELAMALDLHRGYAAQLRLPEMITVSAKGWALTDRAHMFLRRGLRSQFRC
jgi:hypothetical protein